MPVTAASAGSGGQAGASPAGTSGSGGANSSGGGGASAGASSGAGGPAQGGASAGAPAGGTSSGGSSAGSSNGGTGGGTAGGSSGGGGAGGGGAAPDKAYVYLGGSQSGTGAVALYALNYASGDLSLVKRVDVGKNGSFLAIDSQNHALYVADDTGRSVRRMSLDAMGVPAAGNDQPSSGEPVHIAVSANGKFVLTAQYNQGTIEAFAVSGTMLGASLGSQMACGQSHEVVLAPAQDFVFVPCKADSKINRYQFDKSTGALTAPMPIATASGSGPRHLAFAPSGQFAYLINELASTVYAYSYASGTLTELQRLSSLPDGFSGSSAGAEIAVSPSGKDVYASNRPNGQNGTIAQFRVGTDGKLTANGTQSTGGQTPRSFAIDPTGRFLIAGNVDSSSVAVFAVDAATGKLGTAKVVNVGISPWFVGIVVP